jgi:hypothetical protein
MHSNPEVCRIVGFVPLKFVCSMNNQVLKLVPINYRDAELIKQQGGINYFKDSQTAGLFNRSQFQP